MAGIGFPSAPTALDVRILIVDDDPNKRLALRAILETLDCSIVEASSGVEALRCVMACDFAVILLDVRMPVMNGFETAALLRQRRQTEMTPILFVSAYGKDDLPTAELYAQGAVDFICTPVVPDELRAKVSVFANLYRKAAELALRALILQESADQLRLLTDAAPIGIFQTDADDRYVYTNPRWSELTGIPQHEAAGLAWSANDPRTPAGAVVALADTDDRAEMNQRVEIKIAGATPRVVVAISRVIPDGSGGIAGRVGTLADVTAEVAAEVMLSDAKDKATDASRLKSDFLANMSHEIRTPMNGVLGMTELLLETELDPLQRDYAQTVRTSGEVLLTIINDILDFSKIEAGMLEVESIEFNIPTIVDDVLKLMGATADAKGLALSSVIDPSVESAMLGDPGRLRQVLTNLVGNSVKFTETGTVVIRASAEGSEEATTLLRFDVSDTGDGISAEKVRTIFEPFVQADNSTSRRYGGTGLGLAISSQLVSLMGGEFGVSSELGVGSTFWFTVAVERRTGTGSAPRRSIALPDNGVPNADPPGSPTWDAGSNRGYLLLAEDNTINQKVAVAMLCSGGYVVDTVVNGAEVLRAIADRSYDAILMDCQMPELDGYETTQTIRASEGQAHIPIIAMTAGARQEDRDRCLAAGMDAYVAKPVSKSALLAIVAQWVPQPRQSPTVESDAVQEREAEVVLDPAVFNQLRALLPPADYCAFVKDLVDMFIAQADGALAELEDAADGRDLAGVKRIAHFLKGSSLQVGGRALAASCARLERRVEDGTLLAGRLGLGEVEAALRELSQALTDEAAAQAEAVAVTSS